MNRFSLLFILMAGLVACSEDEDNNDNQPTPNPNFSLKVDGKLWNPSNLTLLAAGDTSTGLTISGMEEGFTSGSTVTLDVENLALGTFAFDDDFNNFIYTNSLGLAYNSFPGSGNYTISSLDATQRTVKGSFSLTARVPGMQDEVEITEGKFDLSYVE
jgi:hypothetical protein